MTSSSEEDERWENLGRLGMVSGSSTFHSCRAKSHSWRCDWVRKQFKMFEAVLHGVRATLKTLNLAVGCHLETLPPSSHNIELSALSSLSFNLSGEDLGRTRPVPFVQRLIPAVPNIHSLELGFYTTFASTHTLVLGIIASIQAKVSGKFANLANVSVESAFDTTLDAIGALREGSLKKLELTSLTTASPQIRPALERHVGALEELTLHFILDKNDNIEISFPERMLNLKRLSVLLGLETPPPDWPFNTRKSHGDARQMRFKFGRGGRGSTSQIDYSRYFPSLDKLTVWPVIPHGPRFDDRDNQNTSWGDVLPFITPIIQRMAGEGVKIILPSSGIQTLDVPFLLKEKYHSLLDNLEVLFPNAPFPPELARARNGPVWSFDVEEREKADAAKAREREEEGGIPLGFRNMVDEFGRHLYDDDGYEFPDSSDDEFF